MICSAKVGRGRLWVGESEWEEILGERAERAAYLCSSWGPAGVAKMLPPPEYRHSAGGGTNLAIV